MKNEKDTVLCVFPTFFLCLSTCSDFCYPCAISRITDVVMGNQKRKANLCFFKNVGKHDNRLSDLRTQISSVRMRINCFHQMSQ